MADPAITAQDRRKLEMEAELARQKSDQSLNVWLTRIAGIAEMSGDGDYSKVRSWYLAQLRRSMLDASGESLTPTALVAADKEAVSSLIPQKGGAGQASKRGGFSKAHVVLFLSLLGFGLIQSFVAILVAGDLSNKDETLATVTVLGSAVAGSIAVLWYISQRYLSRLAAIEDQLTSIANGSIPPAPETPELEALIKTIRQFAFALAEATERERLIADYSSELTGAIDIDDHFAALSPNTLSILGFSSKELKGRALVDILIPEDIEHTRGILEKCRKTRGSPVSFENRLRKRNKETIYLLWTLEWSDKEQKLFFKAQDISLRKIAEMQLKASELRLRSVLEHMPVAVLTLNDEAVIEAVNPEAERMLSLKAVELEGRRLNDTVSGDTPFSAALSRLEENRQIQERFQRLDGTAFACEISLTDFELNGRQRRLIIMQDITERYEIEQLKRDFVAMVSHDLRTPLMSVQGFLTLLSANSFGSLSEQGARKSEVAQRNISRLISLINDLLDIEKLESGGIDLLLKEHSLHSLAKRAVESVSEFALEKNVSVEVSEGDAVCRCDENRIVQVLVNFLSNAVKFAPQGTTVEVSVTTIAPGNKVRLNVKDSGPGIPEDRKKFVFERFKQLDSGKAAGGSGLGLAICKLIVEEHGGRIGVDSTSGEGSTFWIELEASAAQP